MGTKNGRDEPREHDDGGAEQSHQSEQIKCSSPSNWRSKRAQREGGEGKQRTDGASECAALAETVDMTDLARPSDANRCVAKHRNNPDSSGHAHTNLLIRSEAGEGRG